MKIDWNALLKEAEEHLQKGGLPTQMMMAKFLEQRLPVDEKDSSALAVQLAMFHAQTRYGYVESSKLEGCLLGGAVGDALGYPVEFYSWKEIQSALGENGVEGYLNSDLALISDDTQMTLFTAEGILRAELGWELGTDVKLNDYVRCLHESYLDWYVTQNAGHFVGARSWWSELREHKGLYKQRAPGGTCLSALGSGKCGSFDEKLNDSKGCGGLMRVAPIGAYFAQKI